MVVIASISSNIIGDDGNTGGVCYRAVTGGSSSEAPVFLIDGNEQSFIFYNIFVISKKDLLNFK
jgi:hypothetical protein